MEAQVLGNVSTTFSWVPNPTARGSSDILQGCLFTIGLCVWTAVHLNIPDDKQSSFCGFEEQTWRKVGWIIVGLFAPELLIYSAWDQRRIAKSYADAYNQAFNLSPPSGFTFKQWFRNFRSNKEDVELKLLRDTDALEPWDLRHGFYAMMGGFVLDTTSNKTAEKYNLPRARVFLEYLRFTRLLSTTQMMSNIKVSAAEIWDKSKANDLAKSLVCIQAAWFCLQCVARLHQRLPLTLLEINTAAHSLAALSVYLLWWYKPLDIERPTSVVIEDSEEGIRSWAEIMQYGCLACLRRQNIALSGSNEAQYTIRNAKVLLNLYRETIIQRCSVALQGPGNSERNFSGYLIKDTTGGSGQWWPDNTSASDDSRLQNTDLHQLYRVKYDETSRSYRIVSKDRRKHDCSKKEQYFRPRDFPVTESSSRKVRVVFVLLTFIYGGLHALAWDSQFPSDFQQLLWRVSSSIVAGGGLVILVLHKTKILEGIFESFESLLNLFVRIPDNRVFGTAGSLLNKVLKYLCLVVYCLARVYLVVDCFIQLFHLQPGAFFTQPRWLAYVPHFG